MTFLPEPEHTHGRIGRTGIVLVNLGTPDAPTPAAVRRYLRSFLADPRVVELPRLLWLPLLYCIILPLRARRSAKKYAQIWSKDGSPLKHITEQQATLLRGYLGARGHDVMVLPAMRYGAPALAQAIDQLRQAHCTRLLVLPAYPQYSASTTASIFDALSKHLRQVRNLPELRFVRGYADHDAYLNALQHSIQTHWDREGRPERLVMSFHGLPKSFLDRGDPYFCECHKTARLLAERLGLPADAYVVSFQSRLGRGQWLQPYTEPTVQELARQGVRRIDILCPGFLADCLETLEEIQLEVRAAFLAAGGTHCTYIPCLNTRDVAIHALAEIAEQHMIGWPTQLTTSQREVQKQEALRTRTEAKRMGAPH